MEIWGNRCSLQRGGQGAPGGSQSAVAGGAVVTVLGDGPVGTQRVVTGRSVGFPAHFVFVTRLGSTEVTFTDLSPPI